MEIKQGLGVYFFQNGMTVADLKELLINWPDTDDNGNPCEVWIGDQQGLSNQVMSASALNKRQNENGSKLWADIILSYE